MLNRNLCLALCAALLSLCVSTPDAKTKPPKAAPTQTLSLEELVCQERGSNTAGFARDRDKGVLLTTILDMLRRAGLPESHRLIHEAVAIAVYAHPETTPMRAQQAIETLCLQALVAPSSPAMVPVWR